ncbi:MAG: ATP-binding protein [Rickettsiaceae bacterium]|nr:ATP-binding protein [Rickettsiaceae bacterium]
MKKIERVDFKKQLTESLEYFPITALIGPRQCGKSTLAREVIEHYSKKHFFDMEDITDFYRMQNMKLTLDPLDGVIVIDEIQRKTELFPYLRVLADNFPDRRYLILGSASRDLIEKSSETLAGRINYIELHPFSANEVGDMNTLLNRGGFPRSFLAPSDKISMQWRKNYIQSYLERDLPALGIKLPTSELYRFWMMLAHYHGKIINYSEIGASLGISDTTVRRYIALMEDTFLIRCLKPWRENIAKRQTKSPKLYIRDTGILCALLGISYAEIHLSPKIGYIWEGFAIEEIIKHNNYRDEECYFWEIQSQAEVDLVIVSGEKKECFEIKYSDHPHMTKSIHKTFEHMHIEELKVITPLKGNYKIAENVTVLGLEDYIRKPN